MSDPGSQLFFSVGEVASMLGMSPHTIRAWERRHLALHPVRTASGQRRYSPEDVELLRQIKFERHAHRLSMRLAILTAQGMLVPEAESETPRGEGPARDGDPQGARTAEGAEDPMQMVANLIEEIVIVLDQDGRIQDANTSFVRFSDLLPRRLRGLRFADFVDPFDRAKGVQLYVSPRRRKGWELNLRGSRRRALFAFDCWPEASYDGARVVLIGREIGTAGGATVGSRATPVAQEPSMSALPVPLLSLLQGTADPIRVFDLFGESTASSAFGIALAALTPDPTIVRSNRAFGRGIAVDGAVAAGLPLRDLWAGRTNDPLAGAVERAVRSASPEKIGVWMPHSNGNGVRPGAVWEVEVIPLRGLSGDVTHLILRTVDAGAGMVPNHADRLLAAVLALRTVNDAGQVYAVATEHARDLIPDAAVLVGRSTGRPAGMSRPAGLTVEAAEGPWATSDDGDPDLGVSLARDVARTGAHLDLQWDTIDGAQIVRAVPIASRRGTGRGALGVFAFARRGRDPFTAGERALMDEFADRVGVALDTIEAGASSSAPPAQQTAP